MDEFRKSFEYFEEKGVGGVLLVLFFMLISLEPLMGVVAAFFGYHAIEDYGILGKIFLYLAVFYAFLSVISGIALKKQRRYAVALARFFLVYRLVFMIPYLYINMRLQIKEIPYEKGYPRYEEMHAGIVNSFIIALSYVIAFSVVWFIYLYRSKRVKELYCRRSGGEKEAV